MLTGKPSFAGQLDSYHRLLNTAQWDRDDKRGTFVLRCAKARLGYWRYLADPVPRLTEMASDIEGVLPLIEPGQISTAHSGPLARSCAALGKLGNLAARGVSPGGSSV